MINGLGQAVLRVRRKSTEGYSVAVEENLSPEPAPVRGNKQAPPCVVGMPGSRRADIDAERDHEKAEAARGGPGDQGA